MKADANRVNVRVEGRELTVSNLDKVLYPKTGFTKGDVLSYYLKVASVMLPHVQSRPLTLRRYPNGVEGQSFFEKHVPRGAPEWVKTATLPRSPKSKDSSGIEFVLVCDTATLIWAANLASLELHVPMWRVAGDGRPERPDVMVFDLDPGEPATIVDCCRVAQLLATELEAERLTAFPKTSGSKGLQLYVSVDRHHHRDDTLNAARQIAERMAEQHAGLVVANMRKDLRKGKVLIDWSQNNVAKTTVAVYSLRALPEPSVSTPVTWEEVEECAKAEDPGRLRFLVHDVLGRIERLGDLFAPLLSNDGRANGPDSG